MVFFKKGLIVQTFSKFFLPLAVVRYFLLKLQNQTFYRRNSKNRTTYLLVLVWSGFGGGFTFLVKRIGKYLIRSSNQRKYL